MMTGEGGKKGCIIPQKVIKKKNRGLEEVREKYG
jgi:hypothetical protein